MEKCMEMAWAGTLLDINSILRICQLLKEILANESNIVNVQSPIIVCGDLHGQFDDLVELLKLNGRPPDVNYLFLGDYVDRGSMSVETITLLCCLKTRYPSRITLLRGNHECRQITQVYGFHAECQKKFQGDLRAWRSFTDVFDFLPLGAVIENRHFSLHGGLSPRIQHLDQLRVIDRFGEIPNDGPFSDIVWSDPETKSTGFKLSPRGAGYIFGQDVVEHFLHLNGIIHISRAHQLCMEGYQVIFNESLSTVWSAPNYCFRFGNLASVMELNDHLEREYHVFKAATTSNQSTQPSSRDLADAGYFT